MLQGIFNLGHHQEYKHEWNYEIRALLKLFPKLLPLWTPFLIYYVVDAGGSTFFMEQGKVLGHGEASLYMLQKIVGFMGLDLINSGIAKFSSKRNQPKWVITVTIITCGMFTCFLICLLSWHVEASRLQSIKNNQDPKIILHFAMFLQFILLGTMNKMVGEMLGKFFCDHADESMHHLEFTFNSFVEGMGRLLAVACILVFRNWIGDTINKSHLDKYYRALAFISLWACVIFIYLSYTCYWKKETEDHDSLTKKMEEGGLTSEPQSFSLHSSSPWSAHFSADESIFASSEHSLHSSPQSSAYFSTDESHFASSGNSLQSSPQSSAHLSSDQSIFAGSEQKSLVSNLSSNRPSTNSKCLKSLTCPKGPPPGKETLNDYRRSRSSPNNLRYRPSAKAISHSQGPSEIN
ncbi:hypothetical protein SLEP1_g37975 [Rubroshorea leprosula]|uniref:Uncharacterized protein n=1 Tax=Rubroshorea leprosula TaxID=152421 RepID=A0AAV5KWY3_9ROSI|nr:hypothetical protein SLEP1_g37975 [Rubroshorea leprosula]